MIRNVLGLVAGVALSMVAVAANAQEIEAVEGPGYPVGEGTVIHPTVGGELGFTNNVFYEEASDSPRAAGLLRLIVEAAIASKEIEREEAPDPFLDEGAEAAAEPAHQKVSFRFGGRLHYDEYLSAESFVREQRTLGADLLGNLTIAPQGVVSFSADDHFVRDTRPTNFESGDGTNRISNNLELALKWQPGGRTLAAMLKWDNQIDAFEDPDSRFANRMINLIHARTEWEFFPYSKAFVDLSYGFLGGLGDNDLGGMPYKRSANPIRGGVGVATAITEIFTVKAHVGWAYASYSGGDSYNTPVAGVELGYRYSPMGRFVVEYLWDHRDSINADFYQDHGFLGRVDHQFGRIVASARGEIHLRSYRGISPTIGAPTRDDVIFAVGARGQYVLRDWLAIVADYRTEVDQTDYRSMTGGETDDPSYVRHEITAGVRAAF